MKTKPSMTVPSMSSLLGKITEKQASGELSKTPIQSVQPVEEQKNANSNTLKQKNQGGRPSAKVDTIQYVKISPRIPKAIKRRVDMALVEERFVNHHGMVIKTLDEIVAFALDKLTASS